MRPAALCDRTQHGVEALDEQSTTSRESPGSDREPQPAEVPQLFFNRELSWLAFNRRVLAEADEATNPLLERLKFAAIFSSNLDEFFMIRVAGVKEKVRVGVAEPGTDGRTPLAVDRSIQEVTQGLLDEQIAILRDDILPALARQGIEVVDWPALADIDRLRLAEVFERDIYPVLTPQAIDRARRFPHVSNASLNLVVTLTESATGTQRFARVKVPATLPRFVAIPGDADVAAGRLRFVWLEQLITGNLGMLFAGFTPEAAYPFHVTRDSDIDLDEDEDVAHDLLLTMRESLSQRTFGLVVRVITDRTMPHGVRDWLIEQLHATGSESYVVNGPLALECLHELVRIDRPDLKDPPFLPGLVPEFAGMVADERMAGSQIFEILRQQDILVHHPYQSFSAVTEFLKAAAADPDVVAIKQTLYRIGKDSPLIPLLTEARDDDTQVAVLVELKARFDEENNITWAERLEEAGVHVAYGVSGLKTHCKVILVVRREVDGLRRYVHIGTGNYNAGTARVYEDFGLMTASEEIGRDVSDLFNALTGYSSTNSYKRLWVAPTGLREAFMAAVQREIESHRRSGNGRIIMKMNALVDKEVTRALYVASQAGVQIDLIVRGVCCLRSGVEGWSENIRVISLVGRYLEHSRIYYFRNGGKDEVYLGSADVMERNFDRRVEAVFPLDDPALKARIRDEILPAYLRDTVNSWRLAADGTYSRIKPGDGEDPFNVQDWLTKRY